MILLDTSVLIEFLRSPTEAMLGVFEEYAAAICGVTRAEVLAGARDSAHLGRIAESLDVLEHVVIAEEFWDVLGKNLSLLRAAGVTVPLADAMIGSLAIGNDLELWTYDSHFERMQKVLPELQLFVPEPPEQGA